MIPINAIRQYHFCPRIVYYQLLTNIKPVYPRHVSLGQDYHQLQEKLSQNRKFIKLGIEYDDVIFDRYFEDETLDISGVVDMAFICKDEVIPLEFKFVQNTKPSFSHIMQLIGYGLLLEKVYKKPFKKSIIVRSNNLKFWKIDITQKYKKTFFDTLGRIKEIEKNQLLPHSSADEKKCSQCEYINFCDDRF